MDEKKDKLLLRRPENYNGHEEFEVISTNNPLNVILKDKRGCYVGFNSSGEQVKPCNLTMQHLESWISLNLLEVVR